MIKNERKSYSSCYGRKKNHKFLQTYFHRKLKRMSQLHQKRTAFELGSETVLPISVLGPQCNAVVKHLPSSH